jgi:hypothetical protein
MGYLPRRAATGSRTSSREREKYSAAKQAEKVGVLKSTLTSGMEMQSLESA